MALSLGSGRRRWPCRAARGGGKRGAGCRHFHVHYHFPRQVCAFSSLRLPPSFSLLTFLLILPVIFLAVLAFLVCFVWFTLVYFAYSLLGKCNSPECLESHRDANELCRNEEQARTEEEIAGNSVSQGAGRSSTMAEACIEGQGIKEVCVDGFSDACLYMSRMVSPYDCTKDEEHSSCEKIVEEVMVFETNCKEFNEVSYLDVSSEKEQLQDAPDDWFVQEIGSRASCGNANLVHLQSGKEFVANRNEAPDYAKSEILELIDKNETRAAVVIFSDNSAENNVKSGADLPVDIFAKEIPEDFFDEQQDAQTTVTDHTNKLREDHFIEEKKRHILGISDETHDRNNECEMCELPLDHINENKNVTVATSNASFHHTSSDEEDGHEKELTEDNGSEASGTTSSVCDLAENNQEIREEIGVPSTEDNIHELPSGESSVIGRTEDEDTNSCTSEGGPRRLPCIRRPQPPWWNLCGVLEVFAGCDKA